MNTKLADFAAVIHLTEAVTIDTMDGFERLN
jgi:hypothetical protein